MKWRSLKITVWIEFVAMLILAAVFFSVSWIPYSSNLEIQRKHLPTTCYVERTEVVGNEDIRAKGEDASMFWGLKVFFSFFDRNNATIYSNKIIRPTQFYREVKEVQEEWNAKESFPCSYHIGDSSSQLFYHYQGEWPDFSSILFLFLGGVFFVGGIQRFRKRIVLDSSELKALLEKEREQKPTRKNQWGTLIIVVVLFLFVGIVGYGLILDSQAEYVSHQCVIEQTVVSPWRADEFVVSVGYSYKWEGDTYYSSRLDLGFNGHVRFFEDRSEAEEFRDRYPKGKEVSCVVNRDRPGDSALEDSRT